MKSKSNKKRVRYYNSWRCDSSSDYGKSLSSADKEWLDKFEREYYCGESLGLHSRELRKDLHKSINVASRDLMTASSKNVEKQIGVITRNYLNSKNPSEITRWYFPSDWQKSSMVEPPEETGEQI